MMYDGGCSSHKCIVYFSTCFHFDPLAGDRGVLQGKKVMMYAARCLGMCLSHFRRRGSSIKVFHQSKKKYFFAVTATEI